MQSNLNVRVTNTRHRYRLAAVAAALTVLFGAASPAGAAGLNSTPDVYVEEPEGCLDQGAQVRIPAPRPERA